MKAFPLSCLLVAVLLTLTPAGHALAQDTSEPSSETWQETATSQLMKTISDWAGAWRAQLPDTYFTFYTLGFTPAGFDDRKQWLTEQRSNIKKPPFIKLRLLDFELIDLTEKRATTRFSLIYETPEQQKKYYKELTFIGIEGIWLISGETDLDITDL